MYFAVYAIDLDDEDHEELDHLKDLNDEDKARKYAQRFVTSEEAKELEEECNCRVGAHICFILDEDDDPDEMMDIYGYEDSEVIAVYPEDDGEGGKEAITENRVGDSEFVSDTLDGFLQDMAQMYADIDYTDIMNFEHSIQDASDPRLKTLKKLYKKAKAAAEYDDDDEMAEIAVEVEDLVKVLEEAKRKRHPNIDMYTCDCGASTKHSFGQWIEKDGYSEEDAESMADYANEDLGNDMCKKCYIQIRDEWLQSEGRN